MVAAPRAPASAGPREEPPGRARRLLRRHRLALLALGGGMVFALAAPPTDALPLVPVGLAVLALSAHEAETPWRGLGLGWLWAIGASLVGMRFVPSVITLFTPLGLGPALLAHVLLSAAQSLHWAAGTALCVWLRRRLHVPLAVAFGVGVLTASSLPSVFPWTPAGLLSPWPRLLQLGDLVGERGVSVLLAVAMALVAESAVACRDRRRGQRRPRPWLGAAAGCGLLAGMLAHGAATIGAWTSNPAATGDTRLGLIHAGVDPRERWQAKSWPRLLSVLRNETAAAEAAGIDLSIWPEAAYPYRLPHGSTRAPRGGRSILSGSVHGPVLFGFIAAAPPVRGPDGEWIHDGYNSATIVDRDGQLAPSHDKMILLAFGESVPLGEHIGWLKRTFQRGGGLLPGKTLRRLDLPRAGGRSVRMGVFNCYEDTLPALGRRIGGELDPNLLVNLTNDAWFVGTAEPELHLRLAAMRAIELRRDLVRAVNLGVSAWIDASGTVRARRDDPRPGWLLVTPTLREGPPTVYARVGDAPAWIALAAAAAASAWRARRRRERSLGSDISPT